MVRLLDVDPDLAIDLDPQALDVAASELVVPAATLDWSHRRGRWARDGPRGHLGLLLLDGLLVREVRLLGTFSAEILGEGDLLRPWDVDGEFELAVPAEVHWTVLAPVEVAVLTAEFLRRATRWPDVVARLTGRGVGRAKALAVSEAISNLKHVETRLLVQFWHLAERWGRVGPDTISISLPVTHEMLAKLVGATRPSVTTGLGRLAARGLLKRQPDGVWQLRQDSRNALATLPVPAHTRLPA
jgi:CRP/FNR family transcriptional regulator, cyclic AMP receptor protein